MAGEQDAPRAVEPDASEREHAAWYRALFEAIDEGFCVIEVLFDGDRPVDLRFLATNPAFERHSDMRDAVGRRMHELYPDYDRGWLDIYARVVETGVSVRLQREAPVIGRHFDVHAFRVGAAEQRRVGVLFKDISEALRTQAALREAEEKLRAAMADAAIGFGLATPDGAIVDVNPAFCRLVGYTLDELRGRRFVEIVHPDDVAHNLAQLRRMFAGELAHYTLENRFVHKSGAEVWVRKSISIVRDDAGEPRWTLALCEDISERRAAELLRDRNAALDQANRDKAEFLAMLSHELRNPLAPILLAIELLEQAPPDSAPARHAREVIGRQSKLLARLVDDLLEVTRLTRGKLELRRERLDLAALVERTLADHRELFERAGLALELRTGDAPAPVDGDANRLTQVLGNLLQNALKFTPRGGHVSVSLTVEADAGAAVLRVRDDGVGVDPAVLPRMFEPFLQADRSRTRKKGGLGLGLAIVQGLVELHGGSVTLHSDGPGCGAQVLVRLPLAQR